MTIENAQVMRKRRTDRSHLIYQITAPSGERYIGLTVLVGRAYKGTLQARLGRHITRGLNETKDWPMCRAIRRYDGKGFTISLLEQIRGKAAAHRRECELIKERKPELNLAAK